MFSFAMLRARGKFAPARADARTLASLYTSRAGMRPCVRGLPKFRFYMRFARGERAPSCADSQLLGLYEMRARAPRL